MLCSISVLVLNLKSSEDGLPVQIGFVPECTGEGEILVVWSWSNVLGRIYRETSLNLPQVPAETHPVLLPAAYLLC